MGWKGLAIGGYIGSLFGGPLGAIIGAALGNSVEKRMAGGGRRPTYRGAYSQTQRSRIFCTSAAAMLAKMAKADGCVTASEIDVVERAFRRLGFTPAARECAIGAFRRAKDDGHTIFDYAREFASSVGSVEMCEMLYEILWDVACSGSCPPRSAYARHGSPTSPRTGFAAADGGRRRRRTPRRATNWRTHTRC